MSDGLPSVAAIYVSWRDTELLLESVSRLRASQVGATPRPECSLVVVVNEADGSEAARVADVWPDATVIANASNQGFGPAADQGAGAARADILLFLNPDTRALGDPVSEIARAFGEHASAVAVAPLLVDAPDASTRGEDQRQFQLRRLPTLASDARDLLLVDRLLPGNRWRRRDRYLDTDRTRPFRVEQAAAAALAVRREAFLSVGGFGRRYVPAWWEDVDLCARLARIGDIVVWPAARLEHIGGVSAERLGSARFLEMYYRNALRYRASHYGPAGRLGYRALLVAGMLLRAAASVPLAVRRREARRSVGAYLGVVDLAIGLGQRDARS